MLLTTLLILLGYLISGLRLPTPQYTFKLADAHLNSNSRIFDLKCHKVLSTSIRRWSNRQPLPLANMNDQLCTSLALRASAANRVVDAILAIFPILAISLAQADVVCGDLMMRSFSLNENFALLADGDGEVEGSETGGGLETGCGAQTLLPQPGRRWRHFDLLAGRALNF